MRALGILVLVVTACGGQDAQVRPAAETKAAPAPIAAKLPRTPGEQSPSLVVVDKHGRSGDVSDGEMLADADSCSTCHPDAAAQWSTSPHSFASFGNPIYRDSIELVRSEIGRDASKHCGGCHDMPLLVDGMMKDAVPSADLRAHTGVSCRLCHGIKSVSKDGNGSYVWAREPIDAPTVGDAASIARHKAQTSVTSLGTELCVGCHRGFLSPDMGPGMPVHLSGLEEPGFWRNSAWTGNGMARIDAVEKKTCIDCHMERESASKDELGAKNGTLPSHRFLGGHTWMASMRGDSDHLRRLQEKLQGVASIDVAGAFVEDAHQVKQWFLPADAAPITGGQHVALDVVIRNLLVGHRFPGGVLDIQDTWIEVEVADAHGKRLAESGLRHATDARDEDTHVLRTLVVDEKGRVLEHHEMAEFRTQIQTQTLAAREAQAVRYTFDVPANAEMPLTVTARLRHRARTLAMQEDVCKTARTREGRAFIDGARGARDVELDPCKPQPITLIAEAHAVLGAGSTIGTTRPAWERMYEHGMALVSTVSERLEEARTVLEHALAAAPEGKPRAMIFVQLAQIAAKQGRADDALALVAKARALMPAPGPAVLDYVAADALMRVWRWEDAVAPSRALVKKAPQNSVAWSMLARCLGSVGDDRGALEAAVAGLEFAPRDPDLLRSQATALAALHRPEADAALAAYDRFRSPDQSTELRISCAADSPRCARERESGHSHQLHPVR